MKGRLEVTFTVIKALLFKAVKREKTWILFVLKIEFSV